MQPEMGSEAYERGETVKELWPSQLELTDGWYKIKANLDPVLEQAVLMENLVSGTKMLIQGAKVPHRHLARCVWLTKLVQLEGGGEGEEPLAAFESSTLGICGNSTVRASWDTKLGFRKGRAICSFKSLRPDGGNVPFIDVVVATMYPMGYKGPFVEGEPQDVWNEDEETERQKVYEVSQHAFSNCLEAKQCHNRNNASAPFTLYRPSTTSEANISKLSTKSCVQLLIPVARPQPRPSRYLGYRTAQTSLPSWTKTLQKARLSSGLSAKSCWMSRWNTLRDTWNLTRTTPSKPCARTWR